jgi:hypothetical protein
MKNPTHLALALAILGAALPASAASSFNGPITFDKPLYLVHDMAVLSLNGTGVCKNFVTDWGDGTSMTVMSYDFNKDGPLHLSHKYQKPGVSAMPANSFLVKVNATPGATPEEQCGSPSKWVEVVQGKVTSFKATPSNVKAGDTVQLTVNGMGECNAPMQLWSGNKLLPQSFPANAGWPRTFMFKVEANEALGQHFFGIVEQKSGTACNYPDPATVTIVAAPLLSPVVQIPVLAAPRGVTPLPVMPAGNVRK